jgi:hypothetical protein
MFVNRRYAFAGALQPSISQGRIAASDCLAKPLVPMGKVEILSAARGEVSA